MACLSRPLARRPAILHGLWLLVLIKLVTPPIYEVAIPWPIAASPAVDSVTCVALLPVEGEDLVVADGERCLDDLGPADSIAEDAARGAIPIVAAHAPSPVRPARRGTPHRLASMDGGRMDRRHAGHARRLLLGGSGGSNA